LGNPTKTTYSWLVESATPGALVAANVAIPAVVFTPPPAPAPGQVAAPVVAQIQAQKVDLNVPQNNAYWVKIVQTTLPDNVDLNELLGGATTSRMPPSQRSMTSPRSRSNGKCCSRGLWMK